MTGSCLDVDTSVLHAVRLLGSGETQQVAHRCGINSLTTEESLLDSAAHGWVALSEFAGSRRWSLTSRGRAEGERRLAAELESLGARATVSDVHARFVLLNARFLDAVTRWQMRPLPGAPMAINDHTDVRWDDRVIDSLGTLGRSLIVLDAELAAAVARFGGYAARYDDALTRVTRGESRWVDGLGIDSCHVVWMQLHEDLLATLGLDRGEGH